VSLDVHRRVAGAVLVLCAVSLCSCGRETRHGGPAGGRFVSPEPTTVAIRLRLALAPPALAEVASVVVRPEWGGVNRGPFRDEGWLRIPAVEERVVLGTDATAESPPVLIASGSLPAGSYTRVYVAVDEAEAVLVDGTRAAVQSHVEPIALPVTLTPGGVIRVDVILTLLGGSSDGDGRPELFVRDARAEVLAGAAAATPARTGRVR
jgi:hypothetical protein